MKYYYINMETGKLSSYAEMIQEGRILYDLEDDTNICNYMDYYTPVKIFDDTAALTEHNTI